MPVSLITPPSVRRATPFPCTLKISGLPPGEAVTATLGVDDEPQRPAAQAAGRAGADGQADLVIEGFVLDRVGRRALVARALDGLGLPLGADVAFVEVLP